MLRFSWDKRKSEANKKKHGVSFEEAQSVFFDEEAIEFDDPKHSEEESRFLIIGKSYILRILLVCHCYREKESMIRIISARKATSKERSYYYRKRKEI